MSSIESLNISPIYLGHSQNLQAERRTNTAIFLHMLPNLWSFVEAGDSDKSTIVLLPNGIVGINISKR